MPPEPQAPRLRQRDTTIERVATLLAAAAPKGLLIDRDEFAGWIDGMTAYNDASGREVAVWRGASDATNRWQRAVCFPSKVSEQVAGSG